MRGFNRTLAENCQEWRAVRAAMAGLPPARRVRSVVIELRVYDHQADRQEAARRLRERVDLLMATARFSPARRPSIVAKLKAEGRL